jgi:hypothetical protein
LTLGSGRSAYFGRATLVDFRGFPMENEYDFLISEKTYSEVALSLNYSRANLIAEAGDLIFINGSLVIGELGSINITIDGVQANYSDLGDVLYVAQFNSTGNYIINASYSGTDSYTADSESWTLTIIHNSPPTFSGFSASPVEGSGTGSDKFHKFLATVSDFVNVSSAGIEISGVNHTATAVSSSNVYEVSVNGLTDGVWGFYWWANDSLGNLGVSEMQYYTVSSSSGGSLIINVPSKSLKDNYQNVLFFNSQINFVILNKTYSLKLKARTP